MIKTKDLNITQFCDGSAYLDHMARIRAARGATMPDSFKVDPLMYQGASDKFLLWNEDIHPFPYEYGVDFEAEVGVIVDHVPLGVSVEEAGRYIKYITIINDISLRKLIPGELAKGFGFFQSKPHSSLAKTCISPNSIKLRRDNLWQDSRLHGNMIIELNDKQIGKIDTAAGMTFSFAELISYAAKTRELSENTLIGSGTVASSDISDGFGCLMERNAVLDEPEIYMKPGDKITMYIEGFKRDLIISQKVADI
jgi:fumarylacetoacetate (FAA) hydrolase